MFVPYEALNRAHQTSEMFRRRTETKRQRLVVEETEKRIERVLSAYGTPLMAVYLFRYLGRKFSSSDDNWTAVERNLGRAQGKWGQLEIILGRDGEDRRTVGRFLWWWCKLCFSFGPIFGFWSPVWRNPLWGFTTGQCGGWQAWALKINVTRHGCIHPLERNWKLLDWRRSGSISTSIKKRLHNTLLLVLSCNCVCWQSGIRECAYPENSESIRP